MSALFYLIIRHFKVLQSQIMEAAMLLLPMAMACMANYKGLSKL